MCRGLLLTVLLSLSSSVARAQDARAWRDSLTRLGAEAVALRDSLVARDSTVVEVVRRNGVVLSVTPSDKTAAAGAFQYFLEQRTRWFGSAAPSVSGFRLVVQIIRGRDIFARFGETSPNAKLVLTGLPDTAGAVRDERAAEVKDLGPQMVSGFSAMMFPTLGAGTNQWLGTPPPLEMADRDRRALTMYMVMTSTGKAERGCIDGSLERCAYALGLRVAPSSDLTGSYPALVRADLFLAALELGGPEAWSRIVASRPGRAEDALVAASGLTADSLLSRWRNGIIALRPDVGPLSSGSVLLVAGWAGVLLLGTLGASRWR